MSVIKYIAGLLLILSTTCVSAQEDDKPAPFKRPKDAYSQDTVSTNSSEVKSFDNPKKKFDISKLLIEPNVQLYFNSFEYQFGLMPSLAYNVWKNLYVGGTVYYSLIYQPHYDPSVQGSPSASIQAFGGGPLVHYRVWKGFFVRGRFEMLGVKFPNIDYSGAVTYSTWGIPALWLGGGYNLTASKNFFIPIAIYFNPLYPTYDGVERTVTPYPSWFYVQVAFAIF